MKLFDVEFQNFLVAQVSSYMVVDSHRSYARGSAGVYDIAHLQGEKLAYVSNNLVDAMYHIAGIATLYGIAVELQTEVDTTLYGQFLFGYPSAYSSRSVKTLGKLPGCTGLAQLLLQVACSKVYTQCEGVVVTMRKPWCYILAYTAYAYNHLGFVLDAIAERR